MMNGTSLSAAFFSGRSFFRGQYSNRKGNSSALAKVSPYGQKFVVDAGIDGTWRYHILERFFLSVQREGFFSFSEDQGRRDSGVLQIMFFGLSLKVSRHLWCFFFSTPDDVSETTILGRMHIRGPLWTCGFDIPVLNFVGRWDFSASVLRLESAVGGFGAARDFLVMQGGRTASGITADAASTEFKNRPPSHFSHFPPQCTNQSQA